MLACCWSWWSVRLADDRCGDWFCFYTHSWTGNRGCGELGPQYWDGHEDHRHSSGVRTQGSTSVCFLIDFTVGRLQLKLNTLEWNPVDSYQQRWKQQWLCSSASPSEWAKADGYFVQRNVESLLHYLHARIAAEVLLSATLLTRASTQWCWSCSKIKRVYKMK